MKRSAIARAVTIAAGLGAAGVLIAGWACWDSIRIHWLCHRFARDSSELLRAVYQPATPLESQAVEVFAKTPSGLCVVRECFVAELFSQCWRETRRPPRDGDVGPYEEIGIVLFTCSSFFAYKYLLGGPAGDMLGTPLQDRNRLLPLLRLLPSDNLPSRYFRLASYPWTAFHIQKADNEFVQVRAWRPPPLADLLCDLDSSDEVRACLSANALWDLGWEPEVTLQTFEPFLNQSPAWLRKIGRGRLSELVIELRRQTAAR